MSRLKELFLAHQEKTQISITKMSTDLGWAPAALGLYLTQKRKIPRQATIKAARFFGVDPREIDPDLEMGDFLTLKIAGTLSGDLAQKESVTFPNPNNPNAAIYLNDAQIDIEGFDGKIRNGVKLGKFILIDSTLPESPEKMRIWLLTRGKKRRLIESIELPKIQGWVLEGWVSALGFE